MPKPCENQALEYLRKYNFSVIPVGQDKRPFFTWKAFQERRPEEKEIKGFWTMYPQAQVGIVTGAISNLSVIDVDSEEGMENLVPFLPSPFEPPMVWTPRGGNHLYCQHDPRVSNKVGIIPGTDLRAEGGYVCFTKGHKVAVKGRKKFNRFREISELKIGDVLIALNEETGKITETIIKRTSVRITSETYFIKFGLRQGVVRLTGEHPLYTTKGWKQTKGLQIGDELIYLTAEEIGIMPQPYKASLGTQPQKGRKEGQKVYKQNVPSHSKKMSGYERFVQCVIKEEKLPIDYVGDGRVIIKSGNFWLHPDFIVRNINKVIEVTIDFYRKGLINAPQTALRIMTRSERTQLYLNAGYECLFIDATNWKTGYDEFALNIISSLRKTLREYAGNGLKIDFIHKVYEPVEVYNIYCEPHHNFVVRRLNKGGKYLLAHNCAPPSLGAAGSKYLWDQTLNLETKKIPPLPSAYVEKVGDKGAPLSHALAQATEQFMIAGRRTNDLFHSLYAMTKLINADELKAIAFQLGHTAKPPLTDREIESILKSVLERASKKDVSLAQDVSDYVSVQNGFFSVNEIIREFDAQGPFAKEDRRNIHTIIHRLLEKGTIERYGEKSGVYRRRDKEKLIINWQDAQAKALNLVLPLGLNDYVYTLPKAIIAIAGFPSAGKSAFCFELIKKNMMNWNTVYLCSDLGPEEIKSRLSQHEDIPADGWNFEAIERTGNFADVIDPNGLNIIDYIRLDEAWRVGAILQSVWEKLENGVAVVCIQKEWGRVLGRGKEYSLEKPRLYLSMDPGKVRIIKCKNFHQGIDPVGYARYFDLINGWKFEMLGPWKYEPLGAQDFEKPGWERSRKLF